MYSELRITKVGLFDGDKDVTSRLLHRLCDGCTLEPGLQFRDLLNLVEPWSTELTDLLTNGPWLKELVEEGKKPVVEYGEKLDYLEICRYSEINNYSNRDELEEYVTIHGVGEGGPYALSFSPMNSMADLEIRLNDEVSLYDWRPFKTNPGSGSNGPPVLAKVHKPFTLLDLLRGVFWELSFHGGPTDREAQVKELDDQLARIESGEEKLMEWDSVTGLFKDLDEGDVDVGLDVDSIG
jgi:hypothetical protein